MSASGQSVIAYIGLGSNLDQPIAQVKRGLLALTELPQTTLKRHSALFRTAPIDATGDDFVNAVAMLHTRLAPLDLLHELQRIENEFGRTRPYTNAPRTLDLDILLYGTQGLATDELIIPHPRLTQRAFALIPLLQLDPFIQIPGAGPAHLFVPGISGQSISKIIE